MLLFAVGLPATFILLGMFAMSLLEPVPEFGGYEREWSRTVRSVISLLLMVVAFRCADIYKRAISNSMNSTGTSTNSLRRFGQSAVIAFLVFYLGSFVSCLLIFENRIGGGIDFL